MRLLVAIAFLLILLTGTGYAQPIDPATIIPKPKNIQTLSTTAVSIDSSWKIAADLALEDGADYLDANIAERTAGSINLDIVSTSAMPAEKRIVIGNPNTNPTIAGLATAAGININTEIQGGFGQGYMLLIQPNQILILGDTTAGTFYGVVSLTWLLKSEGSAIKLPNTKIVDWPDLQVRGFYGYSAPWKGYPSYYSYPEEWLKFLTTYKYNLWVSHSADHSSLGQSLVERHFFPISNFDPSLLVYENKNLYEGVWAQNVALRFNSSNEAVPIETEFVLSNPGFEEGTNDGSPKNWGYSGTGPGAWSVDCAASHSGNCSAKLAFAGSSLVQETKRLVSKTYDLQLPNANKIYLLSFWAKRLQGEENKEYDEYPRVVVVMEDESGKLMYTNTRYIKYGNNWSQFFIPFSTYNNEKKMYIYSTAKSAKPVQYWIDDFQITELNNKLANIIETDATRLELWNKQRTVRYNEGKDYRLDTTGDFDFVNPLQGKKTAITRIETGEIESGEEVTADYDFIVNFQWNRNEHISLAEPLVYSLYEDKISKIMNSAPKPEYMVIRWDEVRGFNRDSRSKKKGLKNYQLAAEFLNKIIDIIHSYNPNTKILIWDDMLNPFHNGGTEDYQIEYGGQNGKSWHTLDLLKRDNVVIISWWYGEDKKSAMRNSPVLYNKLGFKFLAGPWNTLENIRFWSYLAKNYNALGMLEHEWYGEIGGVIEAAKYSWNAKDTWSGSSGYPATCTLGDIANCGSCGNICYYPHAFSSCTSGSCTFDGCFDGYHNDDGDLSNGCETFTQCGNGGIDFGSGEECDSSTIPATCISLGFAGGTLGCTAQCTLDKSGCTQPPECIDTPKLMNQYISQWKKGEISMLALMQKMKQWKAGANCPP